MIPEETHEEVQDDTEPMAVEVLEEAPFEMSEPEMTKERYKALTDKEKVEWLGITDCDVQERIRRFVSKLDSIGIVYKYSADMLDEFMRLEAVAERKEREEKQLEKETGRKYTTR